MESSNRFGHNAAHYLQLRNDLPNKAEIVLLLSKVLNTVLK